MSAGVGILTTTSPFCGRPLWAASYSSRTFLAGPTPALIPHPSKPGLYLTSANPGSIDILHVMHKSYRYTHNTGRINQTQFHSLSPCLLLRFSPVSRDIVSPSISLSGG